MASRLREKVRMKVLIIGAAGMIGPKLTSRLVRDGKLAGKAITNAHLVDVVAPQLPANAPFTVTLDAFDIAASYVASKLGPPRPSIIFLLASGLACAPACLKKGRPGSSPASFGGPLPARRPFYRSVRMFVPGTPRPEPRSSS